MKIIHRMNLLLVCQCLLCLCIFPVIAQAFYTDISDLMPFLKAGCQIHEKEYELDCSQVQSLKPFLCKYTRPTDKALDALEPKVAIVTCDFTQEVDQKSPQRPSVLNRDCDGRYKNSYVVFHQGQFLELKTAEEFKSFFAPITSPEEAKAFAVAITGDYNWDKITTSDFDLEKMTKESGAKGNLVKYLNVQSHAIEPAFAKKVSGGYQVRLYSDNSCDCGPLGYFAVDYLVSKEGTIKEMKRTEVYRDPKLKGSCAD